MVQPVLQFHLAQLEPMDLPLAFPMLHNAPYARLGVTVDLALPELPYVGQVPTNPTQELLL